MTEKMAIEQNYNVLARKYRPQDFSDLIGQEAMVRTFTNAFKTGRIAQAWMLTGVRGVGKTTTARILARALNYKTKEIDHPHIDLQQDGEHCQAIIEGRHIDVVEMDAASHTGIDDIRDIIEQIHYKPLSARYKIYIIDEVHMLSNQAFNGLLKTLEEPPLHAKFIFATTEIQKVPITILSRCQRFDLKRVDTHILIEHLKKIAQKENIPAHHQALAMLARVSEGSVRDALSLLDQAIAYGGGEVHIKDVETMLGLADRSRILTLFQYIMAGESAKALEEFEQHYMQGADPIAILTSLADLNHKVTKIHFLPQVFDESFTKEQHEQAQNLAQNLSLRTLSRNWQMLLKAIEEARLSSSPVQACEMALIRLCHAAHLPPLDEILQKIANPNTQTMASAPIKEDEKKTLSKPNNVEKDKEKAQINSSTIIAEKTEEEQPQAAPQAKPLHTLVKTEEKQQNEEEIYAALRDLIEQADAKKEMLLKINLKECIRPIAVGPNYLKFSGIENAPSSLVTDLQKMLYDLTQQKWHVEMVKGGGLLTLGEQEKQKKEAKQQRLLEEVSDNKDVQAILTRFAGAKITHIEEKEEDKT